MIPLSLHALPGTLLNLVDGIDTRGDKIEQI
jgi:hypothetical protein